MSNKVNGSLVWFSTFSEKGDNVYDFLFAFLYTNPLPISIYLEQLQLSGGWAYGQGYCG